MNLDSDYVVSKIRVKSEYVYLLDMLARECHGKKMVECIVIPCGGSLCVYRFDLEESQAQFLAEMTQKLGNHAWKA